MTSFDDVDGLRCPYCGYVNVLPVKRFAAARRCSCCLGFFVEKQSDCEDLPVCEDCLGLVFF